MIFKARGDTYVITDAEHGIEFHVDRLRRDRYAGDLVGELRVYCGILGAKVLENNSLSAGRFNFSSLDARSKHARFLRERARTDGTLDWLQRLEEVCQVTLDAERRGEPAVLLRAVPRPAPDDEHDVGGLRAPKAHQTIWFGDGGTCKSYLGLHYAIEVARRGINVGYVDWELDAGQHRDRLERLTGPSMPAIQYIRCERPLVYEVDRLKRIRHDKDLEFLIYDSIAPACDGPPEAAEVAAAYHRARRQIGCGGIDIAHINKGPTDASEQKPFGSAFWFNLARSVWNVKAVPSSDSGTVSVAFYHRKANLGPLRPAVGFTVTFTEDTTHVTRSNVGDVAELAGSLPLWQRIKTAVAHGPQTLVSLSEDLDAKVDTVKKAVQRHPGMFTRITGKDGIHRIALVERRVS